jgi:hypothetical protein
MGSFFNGGSRVIWAILLDYYDFKKVYGNLLLM